MSADTFKYFSGDVELTAIHTRKNEEISAMFPGIKVKASDYYYKWVGRNPETKDLMPVTRIIQYKKNPSLHKCDARCQCARGGTCECSCGGKYHGINR